MSAAFSAWCVVVTDKIVEARELPYSMLTAPFVLTIHKDQRDAEQAATRSMLMREAVEAQYAESLQRERDIRGAAEPGSSAWAASVAHEIALLNKLAAAVRDITQPRQSKR